MYAGALPFCTVCDAQYHSCKVRARALHCWDLVTSTTFLCASKAVSATACWSFECRHARNGVVLTNRFLQKPSAKAPYATSATSVYAAGHGIGAAALQALLVLRDCLLHCKPPRPWLAAATLCSTDDGRMGLPLSLFCKCQLGPG
jgi:hypothetical protein